MSNSEESGDDDDNINWMIAEYKKRKRKDQEFTREQIKEVIGSVSPTQITKKNKNKPRSTKHKPRNGKYEQCKHT